MEEAEYFEFRIYLEHVSLKPCISLIPGKTTSGIYRLAELKGSSIMGGVWFSGLGGLNSGGGNQHSSVIHCLNDAYNSLWSMGGLAPPSP